MSETSVGLPATSLCIADLLADPFLFSVPVYQRPYSWTLKEASQLLEDLVGAAGIDNADTSEPDYFLGSILLLSTAGETAISREGAPRVYEIIDGQQRLVTLAILLCVLRDLDESSEGTVRAAINGMIRSTGSAPNGRRTPHRLELRGQQQAFLESCVLAEAACGAMPDEDGLGEAERRLLEIREHFIDELISFDAGQRNAFVQYLRQRCFFVVMMTRDLDRAHRMFLVLNGRGKPLSRQDILKAEILNKVPEAAADRAVDAWDTTAARLDDEKFEAFFSHVRAIHGHYRPQVIAGIRAIIAEVGGAQPFVETVFEPLATAYHRVLQPGPLNVHGPEAEIRRRLVYLHRLNGSEWMPAAMVACRWHANDPAKLARELAEIERFAHVLRLLCLGSGKRIRRFADVVEALQAGRSLSSSDGPCRLNRDDRKTISFNLRDLHGRNQQICKLVLLRLNDELGGSLHEVEPSELSIEHVLPQRTGPGSPWRQVFPEAQEREDCIQSLGNLLLVTQRQNDRARNQEFERKREIYREARGSALEPLTADILGASQWRPAEVRAREAKLLGLVDTIWRIDLIGEGPRPAAPTVGGRQRGHGRT